MDWLNYHHLLYFHTVARTGSITEACKELHLAQPTISTQLRKLEDSLGTPLFVKEGRHLQMTQTGQTVFQYADQIFSLGRELLHTVKGKAADKATKFSVGVLDVLPKHIVHQLLKPALQSPENAVRITCYEGKLDSLLADLALHRIDLVLSDTPLTRSLHIKAYNHFLGQCGTSVIDQKKFMATLAQDFPRSLSNVPLLLPTDTTELRRAVDQWFEENRIVPNIVGEFEDSALIKVFGSEGTGVFFVPSVLESQLCQQYQLESAGRIDEIQERFYAISVERMLKHPSVLAITNAARNKLFADSPSQPRRG